MKIVLINSSTNLTALRKSLAQAHSLRVAIDGEQVNFKFNGGIWQPPMGQLDPSSEYVEYLNSIKHQSRGNKPGDQCGTENCSGTARFIPISEGNRGSSVYRCEDCCDRIAVASDLKVCTCKDCR